MVCSPSQPVCTQTLQAYSRKIVCAAWKASAGCDYSRGWVLFAFSASCSFTKQITSGGLCVHTCVCETPWMFHFTHVVTKWTGHARHQTNENEDWSTDRILNIFGRLVVLCRLLKALVFCCAKRPNTNGKPTCLKGSSSWLKLRSVLLKECYAWLLEFVVGLTAAAQEDILTYQVGVTTHRDSYMSYARFISSGYYQSQSVFKGKELPWTCNCILGCAQQCYLKTFQIKLISILGRVN